MHIDIIQYSIFRIQIRSLCPLKHTQLQLHIEILENSMFWIRIFNFNLLKKKWYWYTINAPRLFGHTVYQSVSILKALCTTAIIFYNKKIYWYTVSYVIGRDFCHTKYGKDFLDIQYCYYILSAMIRTGSIGSFSIA